MNNRLYTIRGNNLNCIEKAGKENKKIRLVEKDINKSKNVLITQIEASSYLMVEIFKNNNDISKEIKKAEKNKDKIHYFKINGKQQNTNKRLDHLF